MAHSILFITYLVLRVAAIPRSIITRQTNSTTHIPGTPPSNAGVPLEGFVSFSIEFSSFPDFAGNCSSPNIFSNNLLNNLSNLSGTKPHIRVGGNTQDYAVFNRSQPEATIAIVNPDISPDYPTTLTIGPVFFESYQTWPGVKYVHGFNLGRNSTVAREGLINSVAYACKTLGSDDRLLYWELGNEPDLFKTSAQGPVRLRNWTEGIMFLNGSIGLWIPSRRGRVDWMLMRILLSSVRISESPLSPRGSYANPPRSYISGAETPGVTLQRTLMNHTSTVSSIAKHINSSTFLSNLSPDLNPDLPYILGETNSLYNQGRPGLTNTFGAALWGIDFNLWCATNNIWRVHMHMGTNYRYQSWQPIDTELATKGTKAPYYGNIAVAAFLEDIAASPPSIVILPLESDEEAAYAAYVDGELKEGYRR